MARLGRGPEVKQISEGTEDTNPLEDVPASYHAVQPVGINSGAFNTGTPSQNLLLPTLVYCVATSAGQDRATHGVTTPENLCVVGKSYQVKRLTLRYLIDFKEMGTLPPGAFRFRVVAGYINNNAFDGQSYAGFQGHATQIVNKYFRPEKKFGGLGITGELVVISDKVHQVVPLSAQGSTSSVATGKVTYAAINGFVDFSRYVSGVKMLRASTAKPNGDGNMLIDNTRVNSAARIPFLLVQNLDGMEGKESGNKSPKMSYFFAKQYVDY